MKIIVLTNSGLEGLEGRRRERIDQLRALLRRAPAEATLRLLPAQELTKAAAEAARDGADVVAAAGGDGTLSAVARGLVGGVTPLGIIPLGTFNHFARDVGIPLDLEQAVATLATGRQRQVDVGEVSGHTFLNNVSLGAYPAMVIDRDLQRVRFGRPKWRAMLVSSLRTLKRLPLVEVRLALDDAAPWQLTCCVLVGNNRYRLGPLAGAARPALDSGMLSVYAAAASTRAAVLRLGWLAAWGRLEADAALRSSETSEFWIESRRRTLALGVDGEVLWLPPPLHFRSRPGALRVVGPV